MMQVDAHDVQVMDNSMGRIVKQCTSEEKITNKRLGEKEMCRHCSSLVLRCGFSGERPFGLACVQTCNKGKREGSSARGVDTRRRKQYQIIVYHYFPVFHG